MVKLGEKGIFFSCPRDLNTDIYICELSSILPNGGLTAYSDRIDRTLIQEPEEVLRYTYQAFLHYNILSCLPFILFQFQIQDQFRKRKFRKQNSLLLQSFFKLSTCDLQILQNFQFALPSVNK